MKCPDLKLLSRLLDGEGVEGEEELRTHVRDCPRCLEQVRQQDKLGKILGALFEATPSRMVRDASTCPSAEEIALYAEGRVPLYRKGQLLRHFCACKVCARAALSSASAEKTATLSPPPSLIREAGAVYTKGINKSEKK